MTFGSRKLGFGAIALVVGVLPGPVSAQVPDGLESIDCLLEIDGMRYIDGPCRWSPQGDGSFTIYGPPYFATVLTSGGSTANGYWNEDPGATHAHSDLGPLKRRDACWVNAKARICAWKLGERRSE